MYGPGFDGLPFGHLIFTIISGLVSLIGLAIVIAVLFLFVRFLLVATRAAQVYVAKNSPAEPVSPATAAAPAASAAPKPATKPRTPKAPPSA
jgi:Na+-transporting methylmalonyl-CoA/oxaloacetate decarboxylase gamma subunit